MTERELLDLPDEDWDLLCFLLRDQPLSLRADVKLALLRAGQVRPITGRHLSNGYTMGFHSGYGNAGDP